MTRLFDAEAFARQVRERVAACRSQNAAAAAAGVSKATMSRIVNADPNVSHENVLRVQRWLSDPQEHAA